MNKILASAAVALSLCGCGGGGGSSGPDVVASTLDFPVDAAASSYFQSAHHFNLSGVLYGRTPFSAVMTLTPGSGTTTFQGQSVLYATQTLTVYDQYGAYAGSTSSTSYFNTGPFRVYGGTDSNGNVTVSDSTPRLPTTAKVGQSGPLGTSTTYSDSTLNNVVSTETDSWSLEADTASTAWLCLNAQYADGTWSKDCYEIDASGNVMGYKGSGTDGNGVSTLHS